MRDTTLFYDIILPTDHVSLTLRLYNIVFVHYKRKKYM